PVRRPGPRRGGAPRPRHLLARRRVGRVGRAASPRPALAHARGHCPGRFRRRGPGRVPDGAPAKAKTAPRRADPERSVTALLAVLLATRLLELGPTRAQRESAAPGLEFPFAARADEELTGATVRLTVEEMEKLEVLVNDEPVAVLSGVSGTREVPVPKELLAERNSLGLRLKGADGSCAARPGAWRALKSVAVAVEADPTPLPDDLALLPLPFFDRGYDTDATVPIAFAATDEAPLAALAASWFAVDAPIPLTFEAHVGSLPDSRALVLVAGALEAARFGLPPPSGPSVR